MKKLIGTLAICVFSLGLIISNMASAAPSIIPTEKSSIEVAASDSVQATLKVGGDLAGKFQWVEVYYKEPQEEGKYVRRFTVDGNSVVVQKNSVLGFNFGQGDWEYLMIDEVNGFPGILVGLVQINGKDGKGAKLGFK